jgi:ribose 5-phosphate isomerase B
MKVYIASDHAGFELKQVLADFLRVEGREVEDMGPPTLEPQDDYPDYILPLARRVAAEEGSVGIVLGGSGEGEAMAANRVPGARAAEYYGGDTEVVRVSREHNNANILSLGARFVSADEAKAALALFLSTPFSGDERHERRIEKLDA